MSYTYTTKVGSLKAFLNRIKSKELGVPDKVTIKYLESVGYKSTNDRPVVRVLKSIGFVDKSSGVPTQRFKDFRTAKSKQVMASALREAYAELFKTYPNPLKQSNEDLMNFFAQKEPSLKKGTLQYYVFTFKTLCEFADFEAPPLKVEIIEEKPKAKIVKKEVAIPQISEGIPININIQLTLPVTDDATVYDKIFKALKDNLLSRD
jgi:hypothetical protein